MLLILGGTAEARDLAKRVAGEGYRAVLTLAGATAHPAPQAIECVTGGFGGDTGFRRFIGARGIRAIVDATHPFAHRITHRTAHIARELAVPHVILQRPPWSAQDADQWIDVDTPEGVAGLVNPTDVIFLATGGQTVEAFASLRTNTVICRQIDPPKRAFPFAAGECIVARPPFSVADEIALFRKHRVDWLVTKNSGGEASRAKLLAARHLRLRVAMLRRPVLPEAAVVETVEEVMSWICDTLPP